MTSYSTVRPGMEGDENHTSINQSYAEPEAMGAGAYQESAQAANNAAAGTRIPGVDSDSSQNATQNGLQSVVNCNARPIVGFLVSVSKTEVGEYWVLYQGQNTIGSSSTSDIVLSESSVSGTHAVLAIHRNPNESNTLNVGIIDRGSSNGTFVNKNYIGFNPYQCSNLDKITVGNYEMLLMLFDHVEYGLTKSKDFQATEAAAQTQPQANEAASYDYASRSAYASSNSDSTRY